MDDLFNHPMVRELLSEGFTDCIDVLRQILVDYFPDQSHTVYDMAAAVAIANLAPIITKTLAQLFPLLAEG